MPGTRPLRRVTTSRAAFTHRAFGAVLRRAASSRGYRLVPAAIPSADERRLRMLCADGITVALDVGANEGQYALALRAVGWPGRIVSFEPLAKAFEGLAARASEQPVWQCRRLALGARQGPLELNVSASSMSSSILPMHANHERLIPGTQYVATEEVACLPLDEVFDEYVAPADRAALKIDVQGYELEALAGASRSLPRISVIEFELCLDELYIGQPAVAHIIATLFDAGFVLAGVDPEHVDSSTGRTSWANATFRRA